MKKIFCTIILLLIANTLDAQHKTLTLYYPDDSTNVISISNLDSMSIFICGASKVKYGGKEYNTVLIGNQCWLKENLDFGTMASPSNNGAIEKYCYNNLPANCETYGGLYTWNEAMQYVTNEGAQGICPLGWHIPTWTNFQTLSTEVGGDGNALKEIGQGSGGGAGTNTSGFSALLTGFRGTNGIFNSLGYGTYFWSSTEYTATHAINLRLYYDVSNIYLNTTGKELGYSVRCIKD